MAEARLEVLIGSSKFSGEGSESWLSSELNKFLSELPKKIEQNISQSDIGTTSAPNSKPVNKPASSVTLPTFLQETNSTTNQVRKFLATAIWLQDKNNDAEIKTADVTKALRDSRQNRLTNAADSLNQNVGKGFCEKTGSGFFVTGEGSRSIEP
jgi:hypothetical protein